MSKSTKKKPRSKAVAAALKAMENMVFESADLDAQLKQVKGRLDAAGITGNFGSIGSAGRDSSGSGWVQVLVGSPPMGYGSVWPEWAYAIAEGALHFNKKVLVYYNGPDPWGSNLVQVACTNTSV